MRTKIFLIITAAACLLTACKGSQDGGSTPKKESVTTSTSQTKSTKATESVTATEKNTTVSTNAETVSGKAEKESIATNVVTATTTEPKKQPETENQVDDALHYDETEPTTDTNEQPVTTPIILDETESGEVDFPVMPID
jgi:hypothetical protein